jgi:hypothetical protein
VNVSYVWNEYLCGLRVHRYTVISETLKPVDHLEDRMVSVVNTAMNFLWSTKFDEFIVRWLLRKYSALANLLSLKINFSALHCNVCMSGRRGVVTRLCARLDRRIVDRPDFRRQQQCSSFTPKPLVRLLKSSQPPLLWLSGNFFPPEVKGRGFDADH